MSDPEMSAKLFLQEASALLAAAAGVAALLWLMLA
jgi:hypothetical protein